MSTDDVEALERHESLYFTDGNIVLLAPRPDKPKLLFRVHKSVLSNHSSIFADIFHVCDGASDRKENPIYDGTPMIHMSDDADHLASILGVLYCQSILPWTPRNPNYPAMITPILGLSTKYEIDHLREAIVKHLELDWPQTLWDWDRLESDIKFVVKGGAADDDDGSRPPHADDRFPEPGSAIRLAREFDVPSILPAAFYHLSRLSIVDDWDKVRADPSASLPDRGRRSARWGLLSARDFRCMLLGKAEIVEYLRTCVGVGESHYVKVTRECEVGEKMWREIHSKCLQSSDPLASLMKGMIAEEQGAQCSTCLAFVKKKVLRVRKHIWEKLGQFFHLDDQ